MVNTSIPSRKCCQLPAAFLWVGAGACTLCRKRTFDGSTPSACCRSRCCSPIEGDLRSSNQEARESHPTMSTWIPSGYNPWRSKLRRKVLTLQRQLSQEKHLLVHETELQCEEASALGSVFEGRRLETWAKETRLRRVRSAIGVDVGRRRMSGCEFEILLGHCTYLVLVKRPLLSCFHASYRYVQPTYWSTSELWSIAVNDHTHFIDLTIFLFLAMVAALVYRCSPRMLLSTDTASRHQIGLAKVSRRLAGEARGRGIDSPRALLEDTLWGRWVSSLIEPAGKFVRWLLMMRFLSR